MPPWGGPSPCQQQFNKTAGVITFLLRPQSAKQPQASGKECLREAGKHLHKGESLCVEPGVLGSEAGGHLKKKLRTAASSYRVSRSLRATEPSVEYYLYFIRESPCFLSYASSLISTRNPLTGL